jgi:hypothetical protein
MFVEVSSFTILGEETDYDIVWLYKHRNIMKCIASWRNESLYTEIWYNIDVWAYVYHIKNKKIELVTLEDLKIYLEMTRQEISVAVTP